jgi:hypothetical protein
VQFLCQSWRLAASTQGVLLLLALMLLLLLLLALLLQEVTSKRTRA